jgi:hypothetical protein
MMTESPTATGYAIGFATEVLWALTGRQFGLCEVALRPCRSDCYDGPWPTGWDQWPGTSWPSPALIGGSWVNITCGICSGDCQCNELSIVVLPSPINSITTVKIDGTTIPASGYAVLDDRKLIRLGGTKWPRCNDLSKPDTQTGTWSITAKFGQTVPTGGALAVGELACEVLRALKGEECRLPRTVTSLARQGVSIQFPDVSTLFEKGVTGLYLVDQFIAAWNPHHLVRRAKTYSVDDISAHRRVPT